jgi:hypothetical protein
MKSTSLILLIGLGLAGGCASDKSGESSSMAATNATATAQQKQKDPKERDPEVGMTKEQILGMYGKTDNVSVSSEGEVWVYHLNMGEAFIPFNFGYRPKIRTITFDKDGKVAHWSYSK